MKKILYIWKGPFPFEIRIQKICESLVQFGYEVTVLCKWNGETTDKDIVNGVQIIRAGFKQNHKLYLPIPYNPIWKKAIKQVVAEFKPHLIINREFYLLTETIAIAKKSNIPVIVDMAENYPAAIANWDKYRNTLLKILIFHKLKVFNIIEKQAVKSANAIFTVCEENKERVIKKLEFPIDKIFVVHNTPKLDWFDKFPKGINNPPRVFAYHGYIAEERNLESFIIGFNLAADRDTEIELEINGSGSTFESLKQLRSTLQHKDRIRLTGNYSHTALGTLLERCDIGIMPYKNDEFINTTISNKMFDYMAMGKPMITSLAKPMQRIIKETQTGISVDCDSPQAIAEAILSIKELDIQNMSRNGIIFAKQKYNWQNDFANLASYIERFF